MQLTVSHTRRSGGSGLTSHSLCREDSAVGADVKIVVIGGDGIGPEVTAEAAKVITAVNHLIGRPGIIETLPWGADYYLQTGVTIPPDGV